MMVEIVAISIDCHDSDDRYALLDVDAYMTAHGLVTLCLLNKRTLEQCLFHLARRNGVHGLGEWV